MSEPIVSLRPVIRDDVSRIQRWLENEEVYDSWFGRYSYGDPAHLGYHPDRMGSASPEEWKRVFENPEHQILSIYTAEDEHIGEVHIAIEESLGDGQLSILIGNTHMWHMGYGKAGVQATLDIAFGDLRMYRVWVDIPEYNKAARTLFTHLGFVHEGTLRKSRPHGGARHDSVIMGMLATEYVRRVREDGLQGQTV